MGRCLSIAILATAVGLAAASSASAWGNGPTEFGNTCVGNATVPAVTAIGLDGGVNFPFAQNAGPWELRGGGPNAVISSWKAQLGPGQGPLQQQLVAFKQIGENEEQLVGESAVENLVEGGNEFKTRIPIPEYALIGLRGPVSTLLCEGASAQFTGRVAGPFQPGETRSFKIEMGTGVPAIAVAERDEDNDGYGDLTQDGCPIYASYQGPCPSLNLRSTLGSVLPSGIILDATPSVAAQVQASGSVSWRPPPRREKGSAQPKRQPLKTLPLASEPQAVAAAAAAQIWVPLPKAAIKQLRKTSPDRCLLATLTVTMSGAAELEGRTMTRLLHAKLPGMAREQSKR